MPSPFPGMDPYLEDPALWPGVHHRLITYIADALSESLPRGYIAEIGERVYLVEPARDVVPDVFVTHTPLPEPQASAGRGGTAVAVAPTADPIWIFTVDPIEVREAFIQILPVRGEARVVTVMEVLSPSNKAPGSEGRDLYLRKQREVLASNASLVEVDLLRRGEHTVAPPLGVLRQYGLWDYLVCRRRGWEKGTYGAWPIGLRDRLPVIGIPLSQGAPEVEIDLQPLFDRAYDRGTYADRLDYTQEPLVSLTPEDAAWADALLRERGLRP